MPEEPLLFQFPNPLTEFTTTSDNVAIAPIKRVEVVKVRGVDIPPQARDPFVLWGEVIAVGPGFIGRKSGVRHPMHIEKGDRVLYLREAARQTYHDVPVNGKTYEVVSIVQQRDVNLIYRNGEIIPLNDYIVGRILPNEYDYEVINTPTGPVRVSGKYVDIGEGKRFFLPTKMSDDEAIHTEKQPVRVKAEKVGSGRLADNGVTIPTDVEPGNIILLSRYMAWEFVLDETDPDTGYVVAKGDQVYGVEVFTEPVNAA